MGIVVAVVLPVQYVVDRLFKIVFFVDPFRAAMFGEPSATTSLLREDFLVDVVSQPHVEQAVLLLDDEGLLPGQFFALSMAVRLSIAGLGHQHQAGPVAHGRFLDTQLVQDRQHLDFNVSFFDTDQWMIGLRVPGTAIVDVLVDATVFPLLPYEFPGNRMAAVAAGHELSGIRERGGMVDMAPNTACTRSHRRQSGLTRQSCRGVVFE